MTKGSDALEERYSGWLKAYLNLEGPFSDRLKKVIASIPADIGIIEDAQKELAEWHEHPCAICAGAEFFGVGLVY